MLESARAGAGARIRVIAGWAFPNYQRAELLTAGDAYVSARRGGGWDSAAADALACGKPLIATAFGSQAALVRAHGHPVEIARLVDDPSQRGCRWAEPDAESLGMRLRDVFERRAVLTADAAEKATAFAASRDLDASADRLVDLLARGGTLAPARRHPRAHAPADIARCEWPDRRARHAPLRHVERRGPARAHGRMAGRGFGAADRARQSARPLRARRAARRVSAPSRCRRRRLETAAARRARRGDRCVPPRSRRGARHARRAPAVVHQGAAALPRRARAAAAADAARFRACRARSDRSRRIARSARRARPRRSARALGALHARRIRRDARLAARDRRLRRRRRRAARRGGTAPRRARHVRRRRTSCARRGERRRLDRACAASPARRGRSRARSSARRSASSLAAIADGSILERDFTDEDAAAERAAGAEAASARACG